MAGKTFTQGGAADQLRKALVTNSKNFVMPKATGWGRFGRGMRRTVPGIATALVVGALGNYLTGGNREYDAFTS